MKRITQNFAPRKVTLDDDRRGSVLIVVITLLTALMVLGFFMFTRAAQDQQNSLYFADGSKNIQPLQLNQDAIFDSYLRQLILGSAPNEYNSVFYGGYPSLLPGMLGTDFAPGSGEGVRLMWPLVAGNYDPNGVLQVDMDHDGVPDGPAFDYLAELNHTPAAEGSVQSLTDNMTMHQLPQPDVGYTYPDHTSPWLTYYGYVPIINAAGQRVGSQKVVLPSMHRPQMIRNLGVPQASWYSDPATVSRVFRPHREHIAFDNTGNPQGRRYEDGSLGTTLNPFNLPLPNDGHWGGVNVAAAAPQYDADPTGRGWNDAVYVDIGFPIQTDPLTGQQYVPLVAATILDAEAYFNLNIHGNSNQYLAATPITNANFGGMNRFLSRSHQGVSRSEVNPQWGLNSGLGETGAADPFEQYRYLFGHNPVDNWELSNMDLWRLLHGSPIFANGSPVPATQADIVQLVAGRYGETARLDSAIASHLSTAFPWPGTTGTDDNGNGAWGDPGVAFGYGAGMVPAFSHPLDVFGIGSATNNANYRQRLTHNLGPLLYAQYNNIATNNNTLWLNAIGGNLITGGVGAQVGDEPDETVAEPGLAALQPDDQTYGASTAAALQMTRFDLTTNNFSDRVLSLASFNFSDSNREEAIRALFGTTSSDLKAYSHRYHDPAFMNPAFRNWEFVDSDTDGLPDFPPVINAFAANDPRQPIRPELRELMFMEVTGYQNNDFRKLQRKLSVNGALDRDPSNDLRFRPLTPHPTTGLGATRINYSGIVRPEQITTLNQREFMARRDRQLMARDIYTMLYLFGGGNDSINYLTTPDPYNATSPAGAQRLREMAQFAVNVVDALDTDDVVTKFEYDVDLSDGWGLNDYPFDYSGISPTDTITDLGSGAGTQQRGVVYGVETQTLCLNEGLAIIAGEVHSDPMDQGSGTEDLAATEWDDQKHNHFLQFELQNVSAQTVRFNQGQWQVVVRPLDDPRSATGGTLIGPERRLEINSASLVVNNSTLANSFLTVGTVGTDDNTAPIFPVGSFAAVAPADSTNPGPSRIMINDGTTNQTVAPSLSVSSPQYLDLLRQSGDYQIYDDAFTTTPTTDVDDHDSTSALANTAPAPAGVQLLEFNDEESLTVNGAMSGTTGPLSNKYVELVLRRRLDPNRARPTDSSTEEKEDNPWIVMDRMQIPLQLLQLASGDTGAQVQTQVQNLDGSESRYQPLYADASNGASSQSLQNPGNNNYKNSLGERNRVGGTADYTLWQPHFNRDYASLAELLNVPLYGPDRLKNFDQAPFWDAWTFTTMKLGETTTTGEEAKLTGSETFGNRVFNPDPGNDSLPAPGTVTDDNRWSRLFGFLEVPRRQGISGYGEIIGRVADDQQDDVYRNHGPIQLNTLRNPEVLGGMLDDVRVMSLNLGADPNLAALPDTVGGEPEREDWWTSFVTARDQYDPAALGLGVGESFVAPGIPGVSRPFRPLGYSDDGISSIQHTLLRSLPFEDGAVIPPRQLFELGTETDHTGNNIDYAEKYRLLGKAMNHSTTTSNTFYIFLQVDYFEAQYFNNAVRIGAKLASSPGYRGFFVVDRAKALDMVTDDDLPPTTDPNTGASLFSFNQNFDWRSLVLYRRRLN